MCLTCDGQGEADVFREETGLCTGGTPRGRGPGAYAQITEIMPGRPAEESQAQNRTGENPLSGIAGGLVET